MTSSKSKFFVNAVGCIFLAINLIGMGYYLFRAPLDGGGHTTSTFRDFYSALRFSWLRISESELEMVCTKGTTDPYNVMVVRAALMRWRLTKECPDCFTKFMQRFQDGLWSIPPVDVWTRTFKAFDERWISARRKSRDSQRHAPRLTRDKFGNLLLQFPPGTVTSDIGSQIQLTIEVPSRETLAGAPEVLWKTQLESQPERRVGLWNTATESSGTKLLGKFEIDFSSEPTWLIPGTKVDWLVISAPDVGKWKTISVEYQDSTRLGI